MYICSYQQNRVYLSDTAGNYTLLYTANGMNGPVGLREDSNGNLLIANYTDGKIFSVTSGGVFSLIAQVPGIVGFIEYANGYIYATGYSTHKVYKVTLGGQITVLAGTGISGQANGPAATATFSGPNGIVASRGGDSLYISDFNARSLRLISDVSVGITNVSTETPVGFDLKQNYPNPFNPKTVISYGLQINSFVKLIVYDALGNEVSNLVNEKQNAGTYTVDFDGSNFSSGVYYYRIDAGSFTQTKKMLLIK
ncbi:MAG: T9SS type A sorting domain-containing protein, partial [Defluviicoccus sp.]